MRVRVSSIANPPHPGEPLGRRRGRRIVRWAEDASPACRPWHGTAQHGLDAGHQLARENGFDEGSSAPTNKTRTLSTSSSRAVSMMA